MRKTKTEVNWTRQVDVKNSETKNLDCNPNRCTLKNLNGNKELRFASALQT